jgi:hypothetical protein
MSKRYRTQAYRQAHKGASNFSSVGKPRRTIEYVYHVSTLDYTDLDEAEFEIKLPYINNVKSIEILNAYIPANLDSFKGKKLVFEITRNGSVDPDILTYTFKDNAGISDARQISKLTTDLQALTIGDGADTVVPFAGIALASQENERFKITIEANPTANVTGIKLKWDGQSSQESLRTTLGFGRSATESKFEESGGAFVLESPSQCNWKGHNFLVLRTPSINTDSSFAVENPPFHHTNVLAILHTPHEKMGVHFNREWFRNILVRNAVNALHTFTLQVFHEDGRLVDINGGQFFFTFKINADSY